METRQREERTRREMQQRDRNLERQLLETRKREEKFAEAVIGGNAM